MSATLTTSSASVARVVAVSSPGPRGPEGPSGPVQIVGYGRLSLTSQIQTVIPSQNSWTKLEGETGLSPQASNTSSVTHNRIVYVGVEDSVVSIDVSLNLVSELDGQEFELCIYKNGSIVASSDIPVHFDVGANPVTVSMNADAVCQSGDAFEIWVRNTTSSGNITARALQFKITCLDLS